MYIARIFNNESKWEKPDNTDIWAKPNNHRKSGYGEILTQNKNISFGFEEWLFNSVLLNLKIGFLECYRQNRFTDKVDIILFIRNNTSTCLQIAKLINVEQINDAQINEIKKELTKTEWQQYCHKDLKEICNNNQSAINESKQLWDNHYNCNTILVNKKNNPRDGFIINIKYDKVEIFKNPITFYPVEFRLSERTKI